MLNLGALSSWRKVLFLPAIVIVLVACGLPQGAIPVSKLEPGPQEPALGLAGAQRRPDRRLAARPFLARAGDSRVRSAAARAPSSCWNPGDRRRDASGMNRGLMLPWQRRSPRPTRRMLIFELRESLRRCRDLEGGGNGWRFGRARTRTVGLGAAT